MTRLSVQVSIVRLAIFRPSAEFSCACPLPWPKLQPRMVTRLYCGSWVRTAELPCWPLMVVMAGPWKAAQDAVTFDWVIVASRLMGVDGTGAAAVERGARIGAIRRLAVVETLPDDAVPCDEGTWLRSATAICFCCCN